MLCNMVFEVFSKILFYVQRFVHVVDMSTPLGSNLYGIILRVLLSSAYTGLVLGGGGEFLCDSN